MARIREYAPQSQIRNAPDTLRARGDDLGSGAALEQFGQQVSSAENSAMKAYGQYKQNEIVKEKSAASVAVAQDQDEFTTKWQEKLKGGNPYDDPKETDPTKKFDEFFVNDFLADFDQKTEERLGTFKSEEARDYYKAQVATQRSSFAEKAIASQAQLAGEKTKLDFAAVLTSSSSAAVSDPTSFPVAQSNAAALVQNYVDSNRINPAQGQELIQHANKVLAQSALKGLARLNPEHAQAELDSGAWDQYIDGGTKDSLYGEIRTEARAKRGEEDRRKSLAKDALREKQGEIQNQFLEKLDKNELTHRDVLDSPLEAPQKRVYLSALNRKVEAPNSLKTNPAKFTAVFDAINAPEGTPGKIENEEQLNDEFSKGGLSVENLAFLRKELRKGETDDGKREQTIKKAATDLIHDTIMRSAGPKDPQAPEMNYRAQQEYVKQYELGIKNGKTPAELTDPDFVKGVMRPFIRTPVQKLESKVKHYQSFKQKAGGSTPQKKLSRIEQILKKKGLN